MKLDPKLGKNIRRQAYAIKPHVEGVRLTELDRHVDDAGSLVELGRLAAGVHVGLPGFEVAQISFSEVEPGAVKAWHLHEEQDDLWFAAPNARLLVGLWDVRANSKTHGSVQRLVLGSGRAQLLYIPHGVAHGVSNLGRQAAHLVYLLNRQFSRDRPDELRLPWDELGAEFWRPTPG